MKDRITSYEKAIEQSLANHNALIGALQALQALAKDAEAIADDSVAEIVTESTIPESNY